MNPPTTEQRRRDIARSYANVYQRRGKLIPKPCEHCEAPEVEKHIADYDKPLEVTWLCRRCHLILHNPERVGNAALPIAS